ncbi:type II TA system antitoxin MqsA family protein [Alicyclobacillus mengziensis]|uniref:Type II toxin-antitoxin system MqsA family antitoxin n=1 Tax=Alicyclobacillus mengziensis TaxID=2931921 RepID=A0A9X7VXC4_9BACL|nr:type II TA system antitoxin MqsA family protein [Alicyclobacillus mengziensis]QSO45473.1 type II toxin-antitoxin system MqsA family antitoxin [Alicyclobacillus mengziensis]
MKKFCDRCGTDVEWHTQECQETYPVRDEPITIQSILAVCSVCGLDLFDMELDGANVERAYDIYRERHGILSADDIKAIREKVGLTQLQLAEILRCDELTVRRYEEGMLLSEQHNELVKQLV